MKKYHIYIVVLALTISLATPAVPAHAQSNDAQILQLQAQIVQLQALLLRLKSVTPANQLESDIVPIPTCTLKTDKSTYTLGEKIVYTWKSKNAKYASFKQDTSGKDTIWLPGDKLNASGSYEAIASVLGNPSATIVVATNPTGATGSCKKTVVVEEN